MLVFREHSADVPDLEDAEDTNAPAAAAPSPVGNPASRRSMQELKSIFESVIRKVQDTFRQDGTLRTRIVQSVACAALAGVISLHAALKICDIVLEVTNFDTTASRKIRDIAKDEARENKFGMALPGLPGIGGLFTEEQMRAEPSKKRKADDTDRATSGPKFRSYKVRHDGIMAAASKPEEVTKAETRGPFILDGYEPRPETFSWWQSIRYGFEDRFFPVKSIPISPPDHLKIRTRVQYDAWLRGRIAHWHESQDRLAQRLTPLPPPDEMPQVLQSNAIESITDIHDPTLIDWTHPKYPGHHPLCIVSSLIKVVPVFALRNRDQSHRRNLWQSCRSSQESIAKKRKPSELHRKLRKRLSTGSMPRRPLPDATTRS